METNKIELKTLFIAFAAIIFIEAVAKVVTSMAPDYLIIILGVTRFLEIILIILIFLIWGKGVSSLGLARSKMATGFKKGLIWSAGFGIITLCVFLILFVAGANPLIFIHTDLPKTCNELIYYFFIAGVVGPIAEEIFFRGIIYGFFRRWGILIALVLSVLFFVLAHPHTPRIPLPQIIGGIVFAVSYEVEGSLITPITIHSIGNITILTISFLS
jgi:uncharacterized protein